jgi:SAM-dependent methyltransferase
VSYYGPDQALIHHTRFGDLAADAARLLASRVGPGHVTDLGCGSGILAADLIERGYTVTGVDISAAMIDLARTNAPAGTFTVGPALDVQLDESVAVTATGEVLNYATDPRAGLDALAAIGTRAYRALAPGGLFLLDLSTPGRNLGLNPRPVFHEHGTWMLGMHATEDGRRLDRRIVILIREPDGRYRRVDEHHELVLYEVDEVVTVLRSVGFSVETRAAYTEATASTPAAGWAVFVASKSA